MYDIFSGYEKQRVYELNKNNHPSVNGSKKILPSNKEMIVDKGKLSYIIC